MIHPEDEITQLNLGLLHYNRGEYDLAEMRWDVAQQYSAQHPSLKHYDEMMAHLRFEQGMEAAKAGRFLDSAKCFRNKAIACSGNFRFRGQDTLACRHPRGLCGLSTIGTFGGSCCFHCLFEFVWKWVKKKR